MDCGGTWWVSADNVPTPQSRSLADGEWRLAGPPAPWPPVVGAPLDFVAPPDLALGDAERVPGGGKITSDVVAVTRCNRPAYVHAAALAPEAGGDA